MGSIIKLGIAILMSKHYFIPPKVFKLNLCFWWKISWKSTALFCLIDMCYQYGWFFLAKNILHYFVNISFLLLVEKYLCLMVIDTNFYSHCTFCYNIGLPPSNPWKRVCMHVCVFEFVCWVCVCVFILALCVCLCDWGW